MTSHCHAPVELTKQFDVEKSGAAQGRQEDAAAKMDGRVHPFDWWDLLLFALPATTIVFAIFWEAE